MAVIGVSMLQKEIFNTNEKLIPNLMIYNTPFSII